jgi:hypothetical protein
MTERFEVAGLMISRGFGRMRKNIQLAHPPNVENYVLYQTEIDGWDRLAMHVEDDIHFGRFIRGDQMGIEVIDGLGAEHHKVSFDDVLLIRLILWVTTQNNPPWNRVPHCKE